MTGVPTSMTRRELAAMIDHTLLKPEATQADIAVLCQQALHLEVYAVCVSPTMVAAATEHLERSAVKVAAVIGFPSGAHRTDVKADEAARAAADGTDEADMVIDLGRALSGDWSGVGAEIAAVRAVLSGGVVLKVIIESAVLTTEQIVIACQTAELAGADFVKTSTGFHPARGASVEAVEVMTAAVGGRLGVKAAGGIRDARAALAMVGAGATRLGLSSTAAVLNQLDEPQSVR